MICKTILVLKQYLNWYFLLPLIGHRLRRRVQRDRRSSQAADQKTSRRINATASNILDSQTRPQRNTKVNHFESNHNEDFQIIKTQS